MYKIFRDPTDNKWTVFLLTLVYKSGTLQGRMLYVPVYSGTSYWDCFKWKLYIKLLNWAEN